MFCSGKVYVDLVATEHRAARDRDVAICRVEQLYPVPMRELRAVIDGYPNAEEVVWVQEEPENMGAWDFIRPHLQELSSGRTVRACRPAAQREPGRGIGVAPRTHAAGARQPGFWRSVAAAA